MVSSRLLWWILFFAVNLGTGWATIAGAQDWPMLAHDPMRSGATPHEIRPPFARKWYRIFPDEGIMAGVQPTVVAGRVYVPTMRGNLYAIDAQTGKDLWRFRADGPILASPAVADGQVFFTSVDGSAYALGTNDGHLIWRFSTPLALWNSPVWIDDKVLFGGRDGIVYALESKSGRLLWTAKVGGPILASLAVDPRAERVYVACEDMRVYAFALVDGQLLWKSEQLAGVSFRGYYPVVNPHGDVLVSVTPLYGQDEIQTIVVEAAREVFGDWASWRHDKEENARLRAENFRLMENPETYHRQMDAIRRRLLEKPYYQTFFVLDGKSGSLRCVPPIVYAESMNGSGMPPVVTSDGKVVVKYQALLRSRYEHYSPFLNVGYLNPQNGDITPIMDQSRTYGWHDSLLLVHDEQCALVASGRVLINTHQNDVNGLDLDTLIGYAEPFCRNIHEPEPDEALGLWGLVLSEKELPVGKEWLPRGTAVYGGGSSIDVAVTVADDGFYYLPSHELNAGCAVIAYRMDPAGTAHEKSSVPKSELTPTLRETLQGLPWDWDTLLSPRLRKLCGPLAEVAPDPTLAVANDDHISDERLNHLILADETSNRTVVELADPDANQIRTLLEKEVDRVLDTADSPWIFPAAKHPQEAYRFFADPAETLWALALAYPYLEPDQQAQVRQFVRRGQSPGGPWEPPLGRENWPKENLSGRESYRASPLPRLILDDRHFDRWTRLYVFWRWAVVTGDFAALQRSWSEIKIALRTETSNSDVDLGNGRLAGHIAYCRLAKHFHDEDALSEGLRTTREAIRERLRYEWLHPQSGVMSEAKNGRYIFARWRNLTPEVANILRTFTLPIQKTLWSIYVDYHRPTWWLAWNVETAWRNESPFSLPSLSEELYAAQALLLRSRPKQLLQTLDIPWCRGDLFFIRKAAHALTAISQPRQLE